MSTTAKILLNKLRGDKHNSATQITAYTCQALKEILPKLKPNEVVAMLCEIPTLQPSMAPLHTLSYKLLQHFKRHGDAKTLGSLAFGFLRTMADHVDKASNQAANKIRSNATVLTYSSSSIVLQTLIKAKKQKKCFQVYLSEGRPAMEGTWAARKLASMGIKTVLMTDASLLNHVSLANVILLGADALLGKYLIHKVGTKSLVALANRQKVPVWVVTTPEKRLSPQQATRFKILNQSEKEITREKHKNLHIKNFYFDATPLKWVTKIFS